MIKTFTGPMHSKKTKSMMDVYFGIYNKEQLMFIFDFYWM